ncbi:profilin-2 [Cricetulus griseus]|uniref:Profilin n=1 Tax=Cricetulus griseus TaxID=10029 RepID=G3ICB8_CRIGR|nr:profilin-2 [Cricetulus griseus]XP_027287713.1 profilin-2 [Cricetulus griseus]EGW12682.1 Profilin-2 [Cricetulus griseus]ERE65160.1 profilin-2-like protein [Cricetulus griseus]
MESKEEASQDIWQDCVKLFLQTDICSDAAVVTNCPPWLLASSPEGNFIQMTQEEVQTLLAKDEREKMFLHGVTLAGIKCLLIRDNLFTEGNNSMDLRTKGQSRGSQAVTVVQMESVYLVVMGKKGTEGGPLNLKAFEIAGYMREAILQQIARC